MLTLPKLFNVNVHINDTSHTCTVAQACMRAPSNETFGLGSEETMDTVMEIDMAYAYSAVPNARRNAAK
jgi:CxxC motif-containing protein (DUF1111 family)